MPNITEKFKLNLMLYKTKLKIDETTGGAKDVHNKEYLFSPQATKNRDYRDLKKISLYNPNSY